MQKNQVNEWNLRINGTEEMEQLKNGTEKMVRVKMVQVKNGTEEVVRAIGPCKTSCNDFG